MSVLRMLRISWQITEVTVTFADLYNLANESKVFSHHQFSKCCLPSLNHKQPTRAKCHPCFKSIFHECCLMSRCHVHCTGISNVVCQKTCIAKRASENHMICAHHQNKVATWCVTAFLFKKPFICFAVGSRFV